MSKSPNRLISKTQVCKTLNNGAIPFLGCFKNMPQMDDVYMEETIYILISIIIGFFINFSHEESDLIEDDEELNVALISII